jgi:predicted phosphate transport protein (TIGR00153 family)
MAGIGSASGLRSRYCRNILKGAHSQFSGDGRADVRLYWARRGSAGPVASMTAKQRLGETFSLPVLGPFRAACARRNPRFESPFEDPMFGLLPKNLEFFDCFDRAVLNAVHSAELLFEYAKVGDYRRNELVTAIMDAEHTGDRVTHETLDRLEQTYITPIDREDVYSLITRIDDVVDMIDAVAQRMMFYKIESVREDFVNQCDVLVKASRLMADAVTALRKMKELRHPKNGMSLDQLIIAVHEAEEEGDAIHHHFLAELFDCGLDAFQVIKWKELYQLVEEAIDYCDDVACVVHRITLKNV